MSYGNLDQLERELWAAADNLRANSKLTASEYSMPVLGLIFLRHATTRFLKAQETIANDPAWPQLRGKPKPISKEDYTKHGAMYVPESARYDYLVDLPESENPGNAIETAMELIQAEHPSLAGALPKGYTSFDPGLLRELIRTFDSETLRQAPGDVFGRIYEYFLNKFAMTGAQEGGEFFTPPSLVRMIVYVIEPDHGTILDPACGSVGMFVQTGHFLEQRGQSVGGVTFYGQEKADLSTKLARMNLAVHGMEGKILQGNTFYEDQHKKVGECDFVMANPPFNVDGVVVSKLKGSPARRQTGLRPLHV